MQKWKERWNEMLPYEKVFKLAFWIFFGLCLIEALIETLILIGVQGGVLSIPCDIRFVRSGLAALAASCYAVVCWRKKRSSAICGIILAIWWGLDTVWEVIELLISRT
jgi:hypothetical protein